MWHIFDRSLVFTTASGDELKVTHWWIDVKILFVPFWTYEVSRIQGIVIYDISIVETTSPSLKTKDISGLIL